MTAMIAATSSSTPLACAMAYACCVAAVVGMGADSSAINTGLNQLNLLTVIARGSTFYLYVNKQYLTSVDDSASSIGAIGVFGENVSGGQVDMAFSEIQVWKL